MCTRNPQINRTGATLIDVAVGSMLLTILLIPSAHLIGESNSHHRRLANRDTMLYEAEQLLEATKVNLSEPSTFDAAMARPINTVHRIAVSDGPDLFARVRAEADGGLPMVRLLTINVDVWLDSNKDSRLNPDELSESLRTQWAAP